MGKYIRIKKSKNLRFRLISILYLLFISLSIIQIPIGWLRVNPNIRMSLLSLDSVQKEATNIEALKKKIHLLDETFTNFAGSDPQTGELLNPENYAQTDQYFLEEGHSKTLFADLQNLSDSIFNLPESSPVRETFEKLFASDLEHGLKARTAQVWSTWKFSHVPATVVRLQMADFILKLNLLQGDFEIDPQSRANAPELILAYNIDRLHIGDTAFFVYQGKKRPQLDLAVGSEKAQAYEWEKDTLIFVALDTGRYHLDFNLGKEARSFEFDVLPGHFQNLDYKAPEAFYSGIPLLLPVSKEQSLLNFQCNCMPGQSPKAINNQLQITPQRAGWCYIQGTDAKLNSLVFEDSIYIQPLPAPMIQATGISGNKISSQRLNQRNGLDFKVQFPQQEFAQAYEIDSIQATLYGSFGRRDINQANRLNISSEELIGLQYIEVQSVRLKGPDGPLTLSDRLIINVTNHES